MPAPSKQHYASRGGLKLAAALEHFCISPAGLICADLGCSTGGFTDCLIQHGAAKVYAVDTAYGELAWKLRKDDRVVVLERTNALHVALPERVDLITIDLGWTRQRHSLPVARTLLQPGGTIISLIKPHYEADKSLLCKGVLPEEQVDPTVERVVAELEGMNIRIAGLVASPIKGQAGNCEVLALIHGPGDGDKDAPGGVNPVD